MQSLQCLAQIHQIYRRQTRAVSGREGPGLTNNDIRVNTGQRYSRSEQVQNEKDKMAAYDFLKGKNISAASKKNEIWELQKLLNANDYNLSINRTI
jgi:hypothetical protein